MARLFAQNLPPFRHMTANIADVRFKGEFNDGQLI